LPSRKPKEEQPEETPQPAPRQIFQERQRISGLPLYLQGYLSVRHSRCQEFRAYWTELRGTTLFFYDDKKAPTYSQKLDISALISATSVHPDENNSAQFVLMLPNISHDVYTEAISHNVCPLFHFLFNYAVHFQLSVPPDESLLPGQLRRMHEVLEKEKKRIMLQRIAMPEKLFRKPHVGLLYLCFYAVSRQEAIEMLEKNPSCGNLILRPGSDSKNYAITIRHELDAPCLKHYKVISKGTSYVIQLEKQVTLPSLQDVVSYFVTQTRGNLKPFVIETRAAEDPVF
uniref:Signal transducing adaptor family member 1 n=1 Tax=Bubo bubo TaxID=30461 RepID=A0A8C0F6F4_BUBBB